MAQGNLLLAKGWTEFNQACAQWRTVRRFAKVPSLDAGSNDAYTDQEAVKMEGMGEIEKKDQVIRTLNSFQLKFLREEHTTNAQFVLAIKWWVQGMEWTAIQGANTNSTYSCCPSVISPPITSILL